MTDQTVDEEVQEIGTPPPPKPVLDPEVAALIARLRAQQEELSGEEDPPDEIAPYAGPYPEGEAPAATCPKPED